MADQSIRPPTEVLAQVIAAAQRLGIELDENEAEQWLTAMEGVDSDERKSSVEVDLESGVFGHRVVLLDFNPKDLERFREIGRLVGFENQPGVIETALALSGSSAQSKIQSYPGDCDYFERVNILAPTREEAGRILAKAMRQKALDTMKGLDHQLIEVKFGNYPLDLVKDGQTMRKGTPIAWRAAEIQAGQFEALQPDGAPVTITWDSMAADPGWCKLDWVVADPIRKTLANASNMLDVTWEAPDGTITPLDGYLDPYFQEVYLDSQDVPIFSKLAKHVSADALDDYVEQLEKEVRKYISHTPANYGKAAKRMYNVFRLTGRYPEAAFLRELFDEPAALLYQVWSLIRTIDDATEPDNLASIEQAREQANQLVISVVRVLEGEQEEEIVRRLLRLQDALRDQESNQALTEEAEAARAEVINIVNNFFYERMSAVPQIKEYMERLKV